MKATERARELDENGE